ncbi:MAG: hypothetical protein QM831_29430 [Kofleriaceae bacterium]
MKRLPPLLVFGLILQVALGVLAMIEFSTIDPIMSYEKYEVVDTAGTLAFDLAVIVGIAIYARGLTGQRRVGAKLTVIARLVLLGHTVMWIGLMIVQVHHHGDWIGKIADYSGYTNSAALVVVAVGMLLLTRNIPVGVIGIVLSVLTVPDLRHELDHVLPHGRLTAILMMSPYTLMPLLYMAALALAPAPDAVPSRIDPAVALRSASGAMYLQLWAKLALALITLMGIAASGGEGFVTIFKFITLVAPMIEVLGLALFARAAMKLAARGVHPWLTSAAAIGVMLAAGAELMKIAPTYFVLYSDESHQQEQLEVGMVLFPIIACGGIVMMLRTVVALAAEYRDDAMRENVAVRTVVFVVLTLGILFVINYGFPRMPHSEGLAVFMLFAVSIGSVYAVAMAARICREGAELLERGGDTGLPVAKVV